MSCASCCRNGKTEVEEVVFIRSTVDIMLGQTPQRGALSIVLRLMFLKVCIGIWDST